MNFPQIINPNSIAPRAYNCDSLQGNWFEDRCVSDFDNRKKNDYLLSNPNAWQYEKTYQELGQNWKNFPKTKERFSEASDNTLNYQEKDYNMYITTTRHAYDPKYKDTFRQAIPVKDYFKNKPEELQTLRKEWTKRAQSFETSYKTDILSKTGSSLISNKNK